MPRAYYNEFDKNAAAWLRELIKAGLIAAGDVDERDIRDVLPNDLKNYTQCHFFAGIGVWSYALRNAGWRDDRPVWTGSCPCQPFSSAGKGAAFDDERHLWPAFHHLIKECAPATVFGEQVASKDADAWIDLVQDDLEGLGYAVGAVPFPSASVGAPHLRDRMYWVANANSVGFTRKSWGPGKEKQRTTECRVLGELGDTESQRRGKTGELYRRSSQWAGDSCEPVSMANPHSIPTDEGKSPANRAQKIDRSTGKPIGCSSTSGCMAHANGQLKGDDTKELHAGQSEHCGMRCSGGLDNTIGYGQRSRRDDNAQHDGQQFGAACKDDRPGPTNGLWRDADWLFCRDGKWRPVEPGTFPLAHGAAARVVRLRGYGNAINAVQAQAFVEAFLQI